MWFKAGVKNPTTEAASVHYAHSRFGRQYHHVLKSISYIRGEFAGEASEVLQCISDVNPFW
jgi:hypothetical protein